MVEMYDNTFIFVIAFELLYYWMKFDFDADNSCMFGLRPEKLNTLETLFFFFEISYTYPIDVSGCGIHLLARSH